MRPGECINGNVLSEFMQRLVRKAAPLAEAGKAVKVHIFDISFMDRLLPPHQRHIDYEAVRRYTQPQALASAGHVQQSVMDCRLLIAPRHLPGRTGHWVLVVADLHKKTIMYIDPLQGRDAGAAAALAAYVSEEALHRKNEILSTASWPVLYPADIPMQTDDHSCGVYAMVFAECLAAGYPLQQCGISSATAVHARARLLHFLQAHDDVQ